jgi:hypothetical protein
LDEVKGRRMMIKWLNKENGKKYGRKKRRM